jgi:hypothetical protein
MKGKASGSIYFRFLEKKQCNEYFRPNSTTSLGG